MKAASVDSERKYISAIARPELFCTNHLNQQYKREQRNTGSLLLTRLFVCYCHDALYVTTLSYLINKSFSIICIRNMALSRRVF